MKKTLNRNLKKNKRRDTRFCAPCEKDVEINSSASIVCLKKIIFRNKNDLTEKNFVVDDQNFYRLDNIVAEPVENCVHFFIRKNINMKLE